MVRRRLVPLQGSRVIWVAMGLAVGTVEAALCCLSLSFPNLYSLSSFFSTSSSLLFHICQMPHLSPLLILAYASPFIRSYPCLLIKMIIKKAYKMQHDLTRCEILHRVVKICPLCAVRMNDSNFTCREKTVHIFRAKSPLRFFPPLGQ